MAKRVRGYKLDIELAEAGQAKRPALGSQLEQQTRSALATGLLALWSHGKLSATMLQWLAHLAIMDGAGHPSWPTWPKWGLVAIVQGIATDTSWCSFARMSMSVRRL